MRYAYLFILAVLIGACIPVSTTEPAPTAVPPYRITADENPYAPMPEDLGFRQTEVIVTSASISERMDLTPIRVSLNILGSMPSSCNQLRVNIEPPNESFQIFVEVYSVVDPSLKCENVFQQFEGNILLGVYTPGRYTIWINDELVGDMLSY